MITFTIHYFTCYYLINTYHYGYLATAWSKNFTTLLNLVFLFAYIKIWNPTPKSWVPWNKKCIKNWAPYLKVTVAIAVSFYIESLVFEVNTILSGLFKDEK